MKEQNLISYCIRYIQKLKLNDIMQDKSTSLVFDIEIDETVCGIIIIIIIR
jgi:hypothetical protein